MKLTRFLHVGGNGALAFLVPRIPTATSLDLASLGLRMWSDSRDGRRYRFFQSGCPGRKEGGRLMGKASRGEWGLGSRCPPPSSFWLEFCGFSEETPERF